MKRIVYIASPYTKGDVALNVRNSFSAADDLARLGYLPYPPLYTHFWHFLFPHPYEFWTELHMGWLFHCDYVLRLPGASPGADAEVAAARDQGIPVYFSIGELLRETKEML